MKVGIFCSSCFNDYNLLESILNPQIENIEMVISNGCGGKFPELYAIEHKIAYNIFPISPKCNVFQSNDLIVKNSDYVLIFDDGESKNRENILKSCRLIQKPSKTFESDPSTRKLNRLEENIDKLKNIYDEIDLNPLLSIGDGLKLKSNKIQKILKEIFNNEKEKD